MRRLRVTKRPYDPIIQSPKSHQASQSTENTMSIKGLHHNAYRCRDAEETRAFYEDFLGLPLAGALTISETKTGRKAHVLHVFFEMDDGSYLAFFEAPDEPFEFKEQRDYDLHVALEVSRETLEAMLAKGKAEGREVRGPVDHHFLDSIYFRDPNGYVIELTTKTDVHDEAMDPKKNKAREIVAKWQAAKAAS